MKFKFNKPDPAVAQALDNFGRRTQAVGAAITKFGLVLMGAGIVIGAVMLLGYLAIS